MSKLEPVGDGVERYPTAFTAADFRANVTAVRARIDAAAERAGREPGEVHLLPVSKTVPTDRVRVAIGAGLHRLASRGGTRPNNEQ